MKRVLLLAALAACVPAEPDKGPPFGGVSISFATSEATAGKPFVTNDGWTVTIDKTAFRASATGFGLVTDGSYGGYGGARPHIIDPRVVCELRVTQLPIAPATVFVQLESGSPDYKDEALDHPCGVDAATLERFRQYSDDERPQPAKDGPFGSTYYNNGPSLYFAAHAEKNGAKKHVELALSLNTASYQSPGTYDERGVWKPRDDYDESQLVDVHENEGTPVRFGVHYEWLFSRGFQVLADADANGDGEIAATELDAAQGSCDTADYPSSDPNGYPPGYPGSKGPVSISGDDDDDDDDDDTNTPPKLQCLSQLKVLVHLGMSVIDPHFVK